MKNKYMFSLSLKSLFTITILVQLLTPIASAQDDGDYSGYDSIIKELSSNTYSTNTRSNSSDEIIRFHLGIGLISSHLSLELPKGLPNSKTLSGYEARFGIDLFSPAWVAEGAVRTFNPEPMQNAELSLREFDLLILYKGNIQGPMFFNVGSGMSARYLDITGPVLGNFTRANTTPAFVFTTGLGANLNSNISLGAQLSYQNPLVKETIDRGSLDGGLRIAGRF